MLWFVDMVDLQHMGLTMIMWGNKKYWALILSRFQPVWAHHIQRCMVNVFQEDPLAFRYSLCQRSWLPHKLSWYVSAAVHSQQHLWNRTFTNFSLPPNLIWILKFTQNGISRISNSCIGMLLQYDQDKQARKKNWEEFDWTIEKWDVS